MLTNARIAKTTIVTLSPPDGMSTRRAGRGGIVLSSCVRRATFLVLVGLLPTCLARLSATAPIPSSDATASVAVVVDDMHISGILAHRQLGSKSSKTKSSKTKSSKTKSSKTKSSKTKKSDKKKKKKKSSIFNKNGDGSSKSKKKSSSSSKKKSSSSKKSSSKSDSGKKNKSPEMDDITKEVVSMLKARKNVVDGKDKTKALDQNDLRNKVLDELDISDSDRGEAKKIFNDVIEKLEKKDAIKVDGDGDVKIFVSMDDESDSNSDSDDKKKNKKSQSLELSDMAREVVSVLKDRKKVVDGEDKTKTLDQKKLRDKVLDELNVKDGDLGEAKDLFEEALKKLKKKDEIKFDNDGDVKIHVSMDHSKDSSSDDKGIFWQATVVETTSDTTSIEPSDSNTDTTADGDASPTTGPNAPVPFENGDSIIIIDPATVGGNDVPNISGSAGDEASKIGDDSPTGDGGTGGDTDSSTNSVENSGKNANAEDSSTIDLSGLSNGSCGTGCKVGVSFAGVGLLVGVGSIAAKMVMSKRNGEDDFESVHDEDAASAADQQV